MTVSQGVLDQILGHIHQYAQEQGGWTLICIDGPAGSGKSTLAAQLAPLLPAQVVHMDDLYSGWTGMLDGIEMLHSQVLEPLGHGQPGKYSRFDWMAGTYLERHRVPPADFLVVEGCGSACRPVDQWNAFIIWVEADDGERLRRGLERDGLEAEPLWHDFMATESLVYLEHDTRRRAHIFLNGVGEIVSQPG
ncbi:uridine kinase family protein [Jonesia quinghaiensis]|uniref:uridine kinase family protein n=1 Tax=Jonesia quinghaiensis TaxID=262806 RepID=UPI0003F9A0AD|nr:AAA family ATPase [Jonesia quinghaiensis]